MVNEHLYTMLAHAPDPCQAVRRQRHGHETRVCDLLPTSPPPATARMTTRGLAAMRVSMPHSAAARVQRARGGESLPLSR